MSSIHPSKTTISEASQENPACHFTRHVSDATAIAPASIKKAAQSNCALWQAQISGFSY